MPADTLAGVLSALLSTLLSAAASAVLWTLTLLGALGLAAAPAWGQRVALAGSMGQDRALLMIDGQPQVLAVGASARGVTLQRLGAGEATVLVAGQSLALRLGDSPSHWGPGTAAAASSPSLGNTIVLPMGPGGHFSTEGRINGRLVQFVVDTGATTVALSQAEANRIGLDWKGGKPQLLQTANGTVPAHAVTLSSVRVGAVELANVAAVVLPADMGTVLLGNSFLSRFNLQRQNDVMRLERRP